MFLMNSGRSALCWPHTIGSGCLKAPVLQESRKRSTACFRQRCVLDYTSGIGAREPTREPPQPNFEIN
jgi:hypothetical protein